MHNCIPLFNASKKIFHFGYRKRKSEKVAKEEPENTYTRWEMDFDLAPLELDLFYEYLEMGNNNFFLKAAAVFVSALIARNLKLFLQLVLLEFFSFEICST